MFRTLEIERAKGYAILTLNRPEVMNALSRELLAEFCSAFALEIERAQAANSKVTRALLKEREGAVRSRGRSQE